MARNEYYLQEVGVYVGNSVRWWSDLGGRTVDVDQAKRFTWSDACLAAKDGHWVPRLCEAVNPLVTRQLDCQMLRKVAAVQDALLNVPLAYGSPVESPDAEGRR
jgi:hypothetical protein